MAERLTAILISSGHFAASAQACLRTHSPIGTTRPVSSATGMNSAGATAPRVRCRQRRSASKPRWLKAVKWGEEVVKRTEQQRQKEAYAKELGFTDESGLERARR